MQIYGQETPLIFDLTAIDKVPVAMLVGKQDALGTPANSQWDKSQIKSMVYYKEFEGYDHNAFVYSKVDTAAKEALALVKKYNPM